MSIPAYLKPENGPLGRAFAGWLDRAPAGLASRFLLLWFVALYTGFGVVSSGALGLHPELLETFALGQHPAVGYAGHAPLAPWLTGIWFRAFPPSDWAFHLLAMVNAAVGLFAADRIARLYLDGDKHIVVLLLLLLTPFWQFFGQRFGATETILSTWPLATWCFLRAFATRNLAWSVAAGITAALAVMGNYASVFLIAGFVVAVLAHEDRAAFLRSWASWLAVAAGVAALAPHLRWLYTTGLAIQGEAAHTAVPLRDALRDSVIASTASVAAVGAALAVWWLAVRPGRAILRETVWPTTDPDGRTLLILLAVPLALQFLAAPLLAASSAGAVLPVSWSPASTWFLLPVVLLRPKAAVLTRTAAIRITALVAATTIATLAAAPWLAWQGGMAAEGRGYYRLVGVEVTKAWRLATGRPLRIVMGDPRLTAAAAFYGSDHPDAVPGFETGLATPPVTPQRLAADGFAAVCNAADETCVNAAKQRTAGKANAQYITYSTVSRDAGKPRLERFFFILAPPESKPATTPQ